jgi:hypothetical protein
MILRLVVFSWQSVQLLAPEGFLKAPHSTADFVACCSFPHSPLTAVVYR